MGMSKQRRAYGAFGLRNKRWTKSLLITIPAARWMGMVIDAGISPQPARGIGHGIAASLRWYRKHHSLSRRQNATAGSFLDWRSD